MQCQRKSRALGVACIATVSLGVLFATGGCQDESLPSGSAPQATAEAEAAEPTPNNTGFRGGGSALGQARNAAKGTAQGIQQRQREISEQIDEQNNN